MIMSDKIVLAERIPYLGRDEVRPPLEARLRRLASDLEVSVQLEGVTRNGFPTIGVKGPDLEAYTELIRRKLGTAPADQSEIEVDDNFKAYATSINTRRQSIEIEIGPISTNFRSEIRKGALTAQLCDGRSFPVERIAQTYCIQEGVPVHVRVTSIDTELKEIEVWLSDDQVTRFEEWRRQRFHRIIAVGGFQDRIREAIRLSKVERDVIEVDELSLTAHSLVCKLGTEAPGIIAKIGRYIGGFKLYAFLPDRVDKVRITPPERSS